MQNQEEQKVQTLLDQISNGETAAADELFPLIYDELHQIATSYMKRERGDHTLQPTALINEAYLKLVKPTLNQPQANEATTASFDGRSHFIATAAQAMRRVLINHALAKKTAKRAGQKVYLALDEVEQSFQTNAIDLLALDDALNKLKELDPLQHRLVELRFFGGMTIEQCSTLLEVSPRKLAYDWAHARAWLRLQLLEHPS